jgi:hypothetical protein
MKTNQNLTLVVSGTCPIPVTGKRDALQIAERAFHLNQEGADCRVVAEIKTAREWTLVAHIVADRAGHLTYRSLA